MIDDGRRLPPAEFAPSSDECVDGTGRDKEGCGEAAGGATEGAREAALVATAGAGGASESRRYTSRKMFICFDASDTYLTNTPPRTKDPTAAQDTVNPKILLVHVAICDFTLPCQRLRPMTS